MSKLEDIMANAKALLVAAQNGGSAAFVTVVRGKIVAQSYQTNQLPVCGIWRAVNRPSKQYRGQTDENVTYDLVLVVEIRGKESGTTDAVDAELITLRNIVNTALINSRLGGKCAPLDPTGDEASVDIVIPAGYEQVVLHTNYTEAKPAVS